MQFLLHADGARAGRANGADPVFHRGVEFSRFHELLQETTAISFGRVYGLPGEREFACLAPADERGQKARFLVRQQAEFNFRQRKARAVYAGPQIAGRGDFHSRADAPAIHARELQP